MLLTRIIISWSNEIMTKCKNDVDKDKDGEDVPKLDL